MDRLSFLEGYSSVSHHDNGSEEGHSRGGQRIRKLYENGGLLHEREMFSSNTDSRPPSLNLERTLLQKWNSYWVWELLACLGSMTCLGVVIRTAVFLDGTPAAAWTLSITPAAFISVFITISRFLILVGVAQGIAQLRWLYYLGGPRRLDHLDSFDAASRGPLGSLLFTCRQSIRGTAPTIARFGALVTMIALAMDPFAQQVVTYEIRTQNTTDVRAAYMWATQTHNSVHSGLFVNETTRQAYYSGLVNTIPTIDFGCTSGNCTWDPFSSLGYCISCQNVTDAVITTCAAGSGTLNEDCTVLQQTIPGTDTFLTLQNGSLVDGVKVYTLLQSNSSGVRPGGIRSPNMFNFVMAQLLVSNSGDGFNSTIPSRPSWNLTSCAVGHCAKVYHGVSVNKGKLSVPAPEVIDLVPLPGSRCFDDESLQCQEFTPGNLRAMPPRANTTFSVKLSDSDSTIRNVLVFDYDLLTDVNNAPLNEATDSIYNLAVGLFWNRNLAQVFDTVATTLTDYLRMTSVPLQVEGTAGVDVSYMEVRFPYLALPAATVIFGAIFLVWVIIYTARGVNGERFIWKANTIPLLMHGLDGYNPSGYTRAETAGAIFSKAREMRVQLKRNEDGEIRFVKDSGQGIMAGHNEK